MSKLWFFVVLIFVGNVFAQNATFRWEGEICTYTGTYDARKYTEARLRDTLELISPYGPDLEGWATVWTYDEIERLDIEALDRSYIEARAAIEKLDIVDTPYWRSVRRNRLEALEQDYRLRRVTMLAYNRPSVLAEYPAAEACKKKYADPIEAGGDALLRVWREVNLESQSKNADPARLQQRFDEESRSPDRLKFALVETMAFGWWNCANADMRDGPAFATEQAELDKEFRKLFTRVRDECDEP